MNKKHIIYALIMFACFMMTNTYGQAKEDSATTKNADTSSYYVHPRNTEAGRVLNYVYDITTWEDSVLNGHVVKRETTPSIHEFSPVNKDTIKSIYLDYFPEMEFIKMTQTFPPPTYPSFALIYLNKKRYDIKAFNQLIKEINIPLSQYDKAMLFIEWRNGILNNYKVLEVDKTPYVNPEYDFTPTIMISIETPIKLHYSYSQKPYKMNFFFEFDSDNELIRYCDTENSEYLIDGAEIYKSYSYE